MKNYLKSVDAGLGKNETPIFPISIFKVKEGVNFNPEDPNYDVFRRACEVSAKRLFPNFSFLDAPFNLEYYKPGDYRTEVGYMGCRTRVMADVTDRDNETTGGRGNLSFTSINLPRLGIKHGICLKDREKADMKGFYEELGELMDLVKGQLLQRVGGNYRTTSQASVRRRMGSFQRSLGTVRHGKGYGMDQKERS